MTTGQTFPVTLITPSEGIPLIERGAFRYAGDRLPRVGDTIQITPDDGAHDRGPRTRFGYVTRVDASADSPISVVEADLPPIDDLIVEHQAEEADEDG
jgi:hypothetical protein